MKLEIMAEVAARRSRRRRQRPQWSSLRDRPRVHTRLAIRWSRGSGRDPLALFVHLVIDAIDQSREADVELDLGERSGKVVSSDGRFIGAFDDFGFYVNAGATVDNGALALAIDAKRHLRTNAAAAPALTSCGGGSPTNTGGTDLAGTVTLGTTATGCVITFNQAYTSAPHCLPTPMRGGGGAKPGSRRAFFIPRRTYR